MRMNTAHPVAYMHLNATELQVNKQGVTQIYMYIYINIDIWVHWLIYINNVNGCSQRKNIKQRKQKYQTNETKP